MTHSALTALSPLDGRYARATAPLAAHFSEFALIRARVRVEVLYLDALLGALAHPAAGPATTARLNAVWRGFTLKDAEAIKGREEVIRHDVKAVEYWVKEKVAAMPGLQGDTELVHLGLTSEDVNNLAYAFMQQEALRQVLLPAYADVLAGLAEAAAQTRALPMLARTHGQPASPTTLGKELGVFASRLARELEPLVTFQLPGKLNGATGTYAALVAAYPEVDWPAFSDRFVAGLGFTPSPLTTQIEPRDGYAALYDHLRRVHHVLLDWSQDAWRYVSDGYFRQRVRQEEVGSSAMPHKVNPIDFENAEGNLGLANALLVHLGDKLTVSRLQRDLSDSTVLRNVGVAWGHALLACRSLARGMGRLEPDAARLSAELEAHPEVLAEAIQTIMRAGGQPVPYERLKALTRGHAVNREALVAEAIARMPERSAFFQALAPADYVGVAPELADRAVEAARHLLDRLRERA